MQLRRGREAPFFDELIIFNLQGDGYFRIDRRQRPDEGVPLDSIYTRGVEAQDTIEEVTSLNAPLYSS
jgi:hypothetical protein